MFEWGKFNFFLTIHSILNWYQCLSLSFQLLGYFEPLILIFSVFNVSLSSNVSLSINLIFFLNLVWYSLGLHWYFVQTDNKDVYINVTLSDWREARRIRCGSDECLAHGARSRGGSCVFPSSHLMLYTALHKFVSSPF